MARLSSIITPRFVHLHLTSPLTFPEIIKTNAAQSDIYAFRILLQYVIDIAGQRNITTCFVKYLIDLFSGKEH